MDKLRYVIAAGGGSVIKMNILLIYALTYIKLKIMILKKSFIQIIPNT